MLVDIIKKKFVVIVELFPLIITLLPWGWLKSLNYEYFTLYYFHIPHTYLMQISFLIGSHWPLPHWWKLNCKMNLLRKIIFRKYFFLCVVDSESVPSFPPKHKSRRSIWKNLPHVFNNFRVIFLGAFWRCISICKKSLYIREKD